MACATQHGQQSASQTQEQRIARSFVNAIRDEDAFSMQHGQGSSSSTEQNQRIARSFFNVVKDEEKTVILVVRLPSPHTPEAVLALLDGTGFADRYALHTVPSAFVAKYRVALSVNFACASEATMCAQFLKAYNWEADAQAFAQSGANPAPSSSKAKAPTIVQTGATALQFHAANIHSSKAPSSSQRKPRGAAQTSSKPRGAAQPEQKSPTISEADTTAPSPTSSKESNDIDSPGSPSHDGALEEAPAPEEWPWGAERCRVRAQSADSALLGDRPRHESTVLSCAGAGCRVVLRRSSLEVEYDDVEALPRRGPLSALQPRVRTAAEVLSDRNW